ncbi:MAG: DUF3794 domain-containing protein [Clostridia bacterium]|nr:DUF3794 domain-containing protein [Clostridia bacterium]
MVKAQFDNFLNVCEIRTTERSTVECSLNLSEDNEDKILHLSGKVYQPTFEREENSVVYGGLATFNVVFGGEELMRAEAGAKFSFKAPCPEADCVLKFVEYTLHSIKIKKEGGMLYAVATLDSDFTFAKTIGINCLVDAEALKKEQTLTKLTAYPIDVNCDLDDEFDFKKIKRVLFSDAVACVKEVKPAVGAVTVEGVATVNVIAVTFSDGELIKETRAVPFSFEAESDGADETTRAFIKARVDKLALKVYVDDKQDKSTVSVAMIINLYGDLYRPFEMQYVADCYDVRTKLTLERGRTIVSEKLPSPTTIERVGGKLNCDVPDYSRFLKLIGENVEIASFKPTAGGMTVEGAIEGNALFADGENVMVSKPFTLPFSVDAPFEGAKIADVIATCGEVVCKMRSGTLEAQTEITLTVVADVQTEYDVITAIEEGEAVEPDSSAISVYVGANGDTEWDVTKKLGVAQDVIAKYNPEVNFPLKDGDKIIVYRKL